MHGSTVIPAAGFAHPARNVDALGIEPGMLVADFGAGSGAYVLAIGEALKGDGTIYAIDIQKDLLKRIKNETHQRGFDNVEIIWGDLEVPRGTKIADRRLDYVIISNLLFQLTDKKAPLREAWRILKPTGKLAIIDWSESFGGLGPIDDHVVSKQDAFELAHSCGFDLVHEIEAGAHHYGLVFRPVPEKIA
jgi:ubiquinone/menaquinone biosynthesis C-methylase UbiE